MVNQPRKFVYELALPIRWIDMDAFGHVNTCVYFTYFEQARVDWWIKIAQANLNFNNEGPVVVNATCTFLKSIIFPETIHVKVYVGALGKSSYETFYEIVSESNPDVLYAEGSAKIVWVDRQLERSTPIPDHLRKLIETSSHHE